MIKYSEKITIKVSESQKQTLEKLRKRNIKVSNFIREAIKEKIQREADELRPKKTTKKTPF